MQTPLAPVANLQDVPLRGPIPARHQPFEDIMKLRYTIFYVDDVAAALDFYARAFSLSRHSLHESHDYGELATGQTSLAFSSTSLMRRLGKTPERPDPAIPVFEITFEVADVGQAFEQAIAAGAAPVQEVRDEAWGQTTAYVSDPNGYLIGICSPVQLPSPG
jgi:lactoylglutathione lyase